jgi:hypothetical protein
MTAPNQKEVKVRFLPHEADAIAKAVGKRANEPLSVAIKRFCLSKEVGSIGPRKENDQEKSSQ